MSDPPDGPAARGRRAADDRFELALASFEKALTRLREAVALDETPIVRDALIQRFEFTFETAWRAAWRWLRARDVEIHEEAFVVLPRAFVNGLIDDEDVWQELRRRRNQTSHTYRESLAIEVAAFVRDRGVAAFDALAVTLRARARE